MLDKEIRESVLKGTGGSPGGKLDELPQGRRTSDKVRERERAKIPGELRIQLLFFLTKEGLESVWDQCQPYTNYYLLYCVPQIYRFSMYSILICLKLIICIAEAV